MWGNLEQSGGQGRLLWSTGGLPGQSLGKVGHPLEFSMFDSEMIAKFIQLMSPVRFGLVTIDRFMDIGNVTSVVNADDTNRKSLLDLIEYFFFL
jgi:hypothetical protein